MRRRELYGDDPHGFKEKAAGMTPEQRKEYERGIRTLKMFQKARHTGDAMLDRPEMEEELNPSMGAGAYVDDFQKSDAPQFKGKSKKKRQKMAIAAYLDAKETA